MPDGCAIVTGSARGIGAATATALAADGWPVVVNYRTDAESAEALAASIERRRRPRDRGRRRRHRPRADRRAVRARRGGARPGAGARQQRRHARRRPRPADRRPSSGSACSTPTSPPPSTRPGGRCGRCSAARFGRIVNVASIVGPRANAGQSNYAASKAGLIGLTKTVAVEVARRGITVNAVAPGLVETKLTEGRQRLRRRDPGASPRDAGGGRRLRALPRLRARPAT